MDVIHIQFYNSESQLSGSMELSIDTNIKTVKEKFSKIFFTCFSEKKQFNSKRLFAYDSFNNSFNITTLLNDKMTLETLKKKGFCFKSDYIIFEFI